MFEAFLVTTSSEGLRPLGSAAQRSYELVSGSLRDRLGDRHANLFSEPVATSYGDRFDWYAPFSGKAVPLTDLESEDQVSEPRWEKELQEQVERRMAVLEELEERVRPAGRSNVRAGDRVVTTQLERRFAHSLVLRLMNWN